jgi:methionine sulfoxide reductase heme-binding subunit
MAINLVRRILKPVVFTLCLLPVGMLIWNYTNGNLSANPLSDITKETGTWTLRFLMITLSITPIRKLTGWPPLQSFRRMIGLFTFFYVCLHFSTYLYLDKFFDWQEIIADVAKRPFITVGFVAFLMLSALAITSPNVMVRWMGGKNWRNLHRLIYTAAVCGVVHYYWLVKADTSRPVMYAGIAGILLVYRAFVYFRQEKTTASRRRGDASATIDSKFAKTISRD